MTRHADYWRRYLGEVEVQEAESDQGLLQDIAAWRDHRPSTLVERIVHPERSKQVVTFVGQFGPNDLCRLLIDAANRVMPQSAAAWERGREAPGIAPIWNMVQMAVVAHDLVVKGVTDVVGRAVPVNLPLALDVVHLFGSGNPQVMSPGHRAKARAALRDALSKNFTGPGAEERLSNALKDGSPWLMYWVVADCAEDPSNPPADGRVNPALARELAETLLRLAEKNPAVGVPLVVPFFTSAELASDYARDENGKAIRTGAWVPQFHSEGAACFDTRRLMAVLAQFTIPEHLDEQMKARCRAAAEAAQDALRRGDDPRAPR